MQKGRVEILQLSLCVTWSAANHDSPRPRGHQPCDRGRSSFYVLFAIPFCRCSASQESQAQQTGAAPDSAQAPPEQKQCCRRHQQRDQCRNTDMWQMQSGKSDSVQRKRILFRLPSLFGHLLQMPHRFQQIVQLRSRGKLRHLPTDALQQICLPIRMVPQCIHVFHHSLPVCF